MKFWKHKKRKIKDEHNFLEPDEIFLDSSNLPNFNENMLEGKLEKTISKKTGRWLIVAIILVISIILIKIFFINIVESSRYQKWSENNRLHQTAIFAKRGAIYDRNDVLLAGNETVPEQDFDLREYTNKDGSAHVLGFVKYPAKDQNGFYYNTETTGLSGVEKIYDNYLKGKTGAKIIEMDVMGDIISESTLQKPQDGKSLKLSIDLNYNEKLYNLIKQTAVDRGFSGGTAIFMKIDTGEILALTSYLEYDPQIITDGENQNTIKKYSEDKANPYLNRAVDGLYTPGSIIKPFVAMGVLNEEIIDPKKTIISTGSLSLPNEYDPNTMSVFYDWKAHGAVDMQRALAVSSDVYFYEVGGGFEDQKGLGILNIEKYLKLFGFGSKIDDKFLAGKNGTIPNPDWKEVNFPGDPWRIGDTYNTSIGQYGLQITPIQAVRAVSAIANEGVMVEPTILFQDGKTPIKKVSTGLKKEDIDIVKGGMRLAVLEGTASGLNIPSIPIAAKTGTAQIGITKAYVNSWVIGFFPYNDPKYAFVVLMEKGPEENTIGGLFVARQFIEWLSTTPIHE